MLRILVADDNPLTLDFLSDALGSLGLAVQRANNGIEAWQQAREMRCDLLLLDDHMPGLNGAMALARIRASDGPSRDALALATTAANDTRTRNRLLAAGFAAVVCKPVGVQELRALLERHVALPGTEPSAAPAPVPVAAQIAEDPPLPGFDDAQALESVGGDSTTLGVLRGLLAMELDALPAEIDEMRHSEDLAGLLDRLHRLQASAGFCGAVGLMDAVLGLRDVVNDGRGWHDEAIGEFLRHTAAVRQALDALTPAAGADPTP